MIQVSNTTSSTVKLEDRENQQQPCLPTSISNRDATIEPLTPRNSKKHKASLQAIEDTSVEDPS